jgi:pSer/pThr/pTyr-binding forkhead associated (FHA) protein
MLPSLDRSGSEEAPAGRLRLRFRGQELLLGGDARSSVTMGRADENDVVIKGNLISRVHARIDLRKNRYMLTDESINGTFVQRDDGKEQYLRRDSMELTGSGVIGMGRVAARGTPLAVEYNCES